MVDELRVYDVCVFKIVAVRDFIDNDQQLTVEIITNAPDISDMKSFRCLPKELNSYQQQRSRSFQCEF